MILTIILLALTVLLLVGGGLFELQRISQIYEATYALIVADRDAAREEIKILRAALFPQLSKMVGAAQGLQAKKPAQPAQSGPLTETNRRVPWRITMKNLMKQHNSKQIGRDRMADAIESSPQPAAKEV